MKITNHSLWVAAFWAVSATAFAGAPIGDEPGVTAGGCARVSAVTGAAASGVVTVTAVYADGLPMTAMGLVVGDGDQVLVTSEQVLDARKVQVASAAPEAVPRTAYVLGLDLGSGLAVLSVDPPFPPPPAYGTFNPLVGQIAFVLSITPETEDGAQGRFATPFEITGLDPQAGYVTALKARCGSLSGPAFNGSKLFVGWHVFGPKRTTLTGPVPTLARAHDLFVRGSGFRIVAGFSAHDISPRLDDLLRLGGRGGAIVGDIRTGSSAAASGLEEEDVIVAVNDRAIGSFDQLYAAVAAAPPGSAMTLRVLRDGDPRTVRFALANGGTPTPVTPPPK